MISIKCSVSDVKVQGKKYYMISFIDECSPYIIYHTLEINDVNEWKFCIACSTGVS